MGRGDGGDAVTEGQVATGVGSAAGPTVSTPPKAHVAMAPTVSRGRPPEVDADAPASHIGTAGVHGRGTGGVEWQTPNGIISSPGATAVTVPTGSPLAVTIEGGTMSGVGTVPMVHDSRQPVVASGPGTLLTVAQLVLPMAVRGPGCTREARGMSGRTQRARRRIGWTVRTVRRTGRSADACGGLQSKAGGTRFGRR
jgi:hypothetical protein